MRGEYSQDPGDPLYTSTGNGRLEVRVADDYVRRLDAGIQ
jgi:hypothetical protein